MPGPAPLLVTLALSAAVAALVTGQQPGSTGRAPWSYDASATHGPALWGNIVGDGATPAFPQCRATTARQQSPLVVSRVPADPRLRALDFTSYSPYTATVPVFNDGRVLRIPPGPARSALADGDGNEYVLTGAELHVPGEHALGGATRDAELHLVHHGVSGGDTLIVAVTFSASLLGAHVGLGALTDVAALPGAPAAARIVAAPAVATSSSNVSVAWRQFLPLGNDYVTYNGTWTYPPCGNVRWVVMEEPVPIAVRQLQVLQAALTSAYAPSGNARPPQPVMPRTKLSRFADVPCAVQPQDAETLDGLEPAQARMRIAIAAIVFAVLAIVAVAVVLAVGTAGSVEAR